MSEKCGCKIELKTELAFGDIDTDDYKIEFCPLHANAENLFVIVKKMTHFLQTSSYHNAPIIPVALRLIKSCEDDSLHSSGGKT